MELRQYFDTIDFNEIEKFISDGQEENLTLEFKTVNHPDYDDKNKAFDKKNISKAISGFANSSGGIIIWGIKASHNTSGQDIAKEKKPIRELTKFLNILNQLEGQGIMPTIKDVLHEKIDIGNDVGYIKTYIPASEDAPHMAMFSEKHYYKRSGDSFYQCEHYDIADMFFRRKTTKLELIAKIIEQDRRINDMLRYNLILSIKNTGKIIAKYPYLALNLTSGFRADEFGLDGNRNPGLYKVKNNTLYTHNYSGGLEKVIYPSAIFDVDKFYIEIHKDAEPIDLKIDYLLASEDFEGVSGSLIINKEQFLK